MGALARSLTFQVFRVIGNRTTFFGRLFWEVNATRECVVYLSSALEQVYMYYLFSIQSSGMLWDKAMIFRFQ